MCRADGNPAPNITWTRLSDNSVVPLPLTITGKQDEGSYRCTADNGDDNPASKDVFITVQSNSKLSLISLYNFLVSFKFPKLIIRHNQT